MLFFVPVFFFNCGSVVPFLFVCTMEKSLLRRPAGGLSSE